MNTASENLNEQLAESALIAAKNRRSGVDVIQSNLAAAQEKQAKERAERLAAMDISLIKREAANGVEDVAQTAAESVLAEVTAEALTAPELDVLRAERDRLQGRLDAWRTEHGQHLASADQLAGSIKKAIRSGDSSQADDLEQLLTVEQAAAEKIAGRLPDLEDAHREAANVVTKAEEKAVRLAARAKVPAAMAVLADTRAAVQKLQEEFVANLTALVETETKAGVMATVLQVAASPGSGFEYTTPWLSKDRFAREAAESGLAVIVVAPV